MDNEYDKWNSVKKNLVNNFGPDFNERDIWWSSIGYNLGEESNGKNNLFERPVLVLRKVSKFTFIGIPFTTSVLTGNYYYPYQYTDESDKEQKVFLMLHQTKLVSRKRLLRRIGKMTEFNFEEVKNKYIDLILNDKKLKIERPLFRDQSRTPNGEDKNSIAALKNLSSE